MENQPINPTSPKPPIMVPLIIIVVIITGVIVGGGVYLWQSSLAKTLLNKAKNSEQALTEQLDSLKTTLTNLSEGKIQDIKDTLNNNQEVYLKDTPIKITLPKNLKAPYNIIRSFYDFPNSYFSIYLVGKNDEVLGHPFVKNLHNYCNNNYVKIIEFNDCQESVLNGHTLITMYEATDEPNDDLSDFYYYYKTALWETGLTDYPILMVRVLLPDLYTYQWQSLELDEFQSVIYNINNQKIPYTTKIVLDDFDFIMNNINVSDSNLSYSAIPTGYITTYDCEAMGGETTNVVINKLNTCREGLSIIGKLYDVNKQNIDYYFYENENVDFYCCK